MTDPQQAARIAAMRARRGQSPVAIPTSEPARSAVSWAPPTATAADAAQAHMVTPEIPLVREPAARVAVPAPKEKGRHPHVAAGARILVTGLTASSIFGLTSVIAAANRPIVPASDPTQVASAENTAAATTAPAVTDPAPVASAAPVPTVLTLPPAVSTVNSQQAASQPASSGTAAPAPKPAKAPTTTKPAAPATTQPPPPPPATTKASG